MTDRTKSYRSVPQLTPRARGDRAPVRRRAAPTPTATLPESTALTAVTAPPNIGLPPAPERIRRGTMQLAAAPVGGGPRVQRMRRDPPAALPASDRGQFERAGGVDMSDVRVHRNSPEPARVDALAYAAGSSIHLGPGQEQHLGHEAWHVVQQKQGRVRPTSRTGPGVAINDDAGLEREADRMGSRIVRRTLATEPASPDVATHAARAPAEPAMPVVQRTWSRMSTRIDDEDERVIAQINDFVDGDQWLEALYVIVGRSPELAEPVRMLGELAAHDPVIREHIDRTMGRLFYEPGKAYVAWEIVEELQNNELIVAEMAKYSENPWLDDLIARFAALSISVPFRSEVDGRREPHTVSLSDADVIVASNPKPLKVLLAAGMWENNALNPATITQLTALRKTAKLALYRIAGHSGRGIKGSRTHGNMNSLRLALETIANVLAGVGGVGQVAAMATNETDLSGSTNHRGNSSPTEGKKVVAHPLSLRSTRHGSKPKDGRLMKSIRNLAGDNSKKYFQMHLLNDLVFGPGELWNLTPGPPKSNNEMERQVEDPLKRAVLGKGLVINFEAEVTYRNDPMAASDIQISQSPDSYRFDHIDFSAEQLTFDPTAPGPDKWVVAAHQDPDVTAVDGARINWKYGNLPALVPKPRILDSGTTWKDLNAVGVPPAAAKRIAAFVKANPGWKLKGRKDKQDQLADAVSDHDGKRAPNMKWNSGLVYWT